jgi:hypothetical protein
MLDFLVIRPAVADDAAYVIDTWLKSFKDYWDRLSVPPRMRCERLDYFQSQRSRIADSLRLGATLIAADRDDPTAIFGWINHQASLVHFLYVRNDAKNLAIEDELLRAAGIYTVPIMTSHWFPAMREKPDRFLLDLFRKGG